MRIRKVKLYKYILTMKLIPDEKLIKIPIKDNGEKMVCIRKYCPDIKIRLGFYIKKEGKKYCDAACFVREKVAEKLNIAENLLPKGYKLMIRCGYRPLDLQKKRYLWMFNNIKKNNPNWNEKKLREETGKCVAPPDIIPPHSTGGAVDISIVFNNGRQLDMGSRLGSFTQKTSTYSNEISLKAKKNRKLLIKVMTKVGFVNYPTEWWHWSYGDRYWAAALKKKFSIYKGV